MDKPTNCIVIEHGKCFWYIVLVLTFCHVSFISLLERAEEELDCECVFVFFPKSLPKPLSANIGKMYRFFGFELLSPTAPHVPPHCDQLYLFMAYKLLDD